VLKDAATGEVAACQRFILPDRLPPGLVTNVERLAGGADAHFRSLPLDAWAEVSRSTIAPRFRWGASGTALPALVAIKYASIALAVAFHRSTLFSFSDPRTARLTRRLGFRLHQVGELVDFHGPRAPFRIELAELLRSVPPDMQETLSHLIVGAARLTTAG